MPSKSQPPWSGTRTKGTGLNIKPWEGNSLLRPWNSELATAWAGRPEDAWDGTQGSEAVLEREKALSGLSQKPPHCKYSSQSWGKASQILHSRFPSQHLEPSSSKTGCNYAPGQNLLSPLHTTLEYCFQCLLWFSWALISTSYPVYIQHFHPFGQSVIWKKSNHFSP